MSLFDPCTHCPHNKHDEILDIALNSMNEKRLQPSTIEKVMKEKLKDREIHDDLGWTGEWRVSAKNVLDVLIDCKD